MSITRSYVEKFYKQILRKFEKGSTQIDWSSKTNNQKPMIDRYIFCLLYFVWWNPFSQMQFNWRVCSPPLTISSNSSERMESYFLRRSTWAHGNWEKSEHMVTIPSGNLLRSYRKWHIYRCFTKLKVVIFHSYVSLPKGIWPKILEKCLKNTAEVNILR